MNLGDPAYDSLPIEYTLDEGIFEFKAKVNKQRAIVEDKAVENSEQRPPEMRVGPISSNREVTLEFTKSMNFPNTTMFIEANKNSQMLNIKMLSGNN